MPTGNTFESQVTGRKYHIRNNISCKIKKSGLSHIMQEVQPTVCQRNGEHPPRQDEWTPLQHKNKENRKNQLQPTFANWTTLWNTCK